MNSESWADATLVGVAFGSHWGPSQTPGKVWPKQLQPKTLCHPYFKSCLCLVVTQSLSHRLAFCTLQGRSGAVSLTSWSRPGKGSPLAIPLFQWPRVRRENGRKETWQAAGKGNTFSPRVLLESGRDEYRAISRQNQGFSHQDLSVYSREGVWFWGRDSQLEMRNLFSWLSASFCAPAWALSDIWEVFQYAHKNDHHNPNSTSRSTEYCLEGRISGLCHSLATWQVTSPTLVFSFILPTSQEPNEIMGMSEIWKL